MEAIYIINENGTSNYKIGKSGNLISRISNIQTSNSSKIILVKSFLCKNSKLLEELLHKLFSSDRIQGEWFHFDNEQLNNCLMEAEMLRDDINEKIEKNTCDLCGYAIYCNNLFKDHICEVKNLEIEEENLKTELKTSKKFSEGVVIVDKIIENFKKTQYITAERIKNLKKEHEIIANYLKAFEKFYR
jgi:ferredoxin